MRFLQVIHYPMFGGPHNQALRLADRLAQDDWFTTVLVPDEPGNAAVRLRAAGMDVVTMPLHRLRATLDPMKQLRFFTGLMPEVYAIRKILRERRIDLVVINGLVNPHAALAARAEKVPLVWQLLDTRAPVALRRAMMPLVSRLADVVMTTGVEVARVHTGAMAMGNRLVPFFPPVDCDLFRPIAAHRADVRAAWRVSRDDLVIGSVGNVNPQKGVEYLIETLALLRGRGSPAKLVLIGAEYETHRAYSADLRHRMQRHGLIEGSDLVFAGPCSDVERQLSGLDVFVLGSVPRSEGTPTAILEAMACGIPVVATDVGAVREVVANGITGFVVPPLDPEGLAAAIGCLLADPELRRRMGEAGRRRAVREFDLEISAQTHIRAFEAAIAHHRSRRQATESIVPGDVEPPDLRDLLVCPECRGRLRWSADEAHCDACTRCYPTVDGIPVMLADGAAAEHDELDHDHGHAHKQRQADFFDREDAAEFEITRPHGTTALYRWLLGNKFRRSVRGMEDLLLNGTVLTVCGGSGMDAELLSRTRARVVCSDISLGAARRARERAKRFGLVVACVVADVERLPFADESLDIVYVHDGLHHLEHPSAGIAEMARVATRGVSITEPARAAITGVAVRFGLALQTEEAGNEVARLTVEGVEKTLRSGGFRVAHAERYAMYYAHRPGAVSELLSKPLVLPLTKLAWRGANALAGRLGNKLVVTAVRERRVDETRRDKELERTAA